MTQDEKYMKEALKQAKKAYALGEVPIGCVIVYQDKIIGRGYNRRNTDKNTLAHAEITAINKASRVMKDWRLEECTLYVTLEPCQMCAGAIVQARITRAVIGAMNPKAGCGGSILNILEMTEFNHQVIVQRGILEEECQAVLKAFFVELRERNKLEKQMRRAALAEEGSLFGSLRDVMETGTKEPAIEIKVVMKLKIRYNRIRRSFGFLVWQKV